MPEQRINFVSNHGTYSSTPRGVDTMIQKYLPASVKQLRDRVTEISPDVDWSNVTDVSAFLIVLAEWEWEGTNLA